MPYSIGAAALSPVSLNKSYYKNNPVIHSRIRIWKENSKHFNLRTLSFHVPISANPSFAPSTLDGVFNTWRESGLRNIGDLYINGSFASFHQLQQKCGSQKNDFFFRFLQVRNYVKTHLYQFENAEPDRLDGCVEGVIESDDVISHLYDALQHISCPSTSTIKREWEKELGTQIRNDIWDESLVYIHTCSINASHCLIQFKTTHRLHYSKEKLHRIFPEVSPLCDKCGVEEGNLLHSYVVCTKI